MRRKPSQQPYKERKHLPLGPPTSSLLVLNKAFHPVALEACCHNVQLYSRSRFESFCSVIAAKPELAESVKSFGLTGENDGDLDELSGAVASGGSSSDKDGVITRLSDMKLETSPGYPPTSVIELLTDLLRRMVNLEDLLLYGKRHFKPIVNSGFLDEHLCRCLTHLPSLKHVQLWGGGKAMPIDFLSVDPASAPAPRSWLLESFTISQKPHVDFFKVEANGCYPDFGADLAVLPSTLESLDLSFGMFCECDTGQLPLVDEVILSFPNLEHLHLGGNLLSTKIFLSIQQLRKLVCVLFQYHCKITGNGLLSLLQGPLRLPHLETLSVHICACPTPESRRAGDICRRVRWMPGLEKEKAKRVVEVARREGVKLGGNLECAVEMCNLRDGHRCLVRR
ncbi:hypothetical protein JCM8097_005302 [Rhodosporidiobolus ruineniae]